MKKLEMIGMALTIAIVLGMLGFIMYQAVGKSPTKEEVVSEIKLCSDNNLEAYQTGTGHWFCRPKGYSQ